MEPPPAEPPPVEPPGPKLEAVPDTKTRPVPAHVLVAGTPVAVRLGQTLSTQHHRAGREFTGTLERSLVIDGVTVAPRGAAVVGRIVKSNRAGLWRGLARLRVEVTALTTADGRRLVIGTDPVEVEGPNVAGLQRLKTGTSAGLGAVVGRVAGHPSGSAFGSMVGGVIGNSGAVLTGGKPAVLNAGRIVEFRLRGSVSISELD